MSSVTKPSKIDYGVYETPSDLIKAINKVLSKKIHDNITFNFDFRTEKVTVDVKKKFHVISTKATVILSGVRWKRS